MKATGCTRNLRAGEGVTVHVAEDLDANRRIGENMDGIFSTLEIRQAQYILVQQELGALTPNDHVGALRLIDAGLLGTDGWRYMSVEEARECWRVCHK